MVTIAVDEECWRYLTVRKEPGDSMNDVLRRELGLDDDGGESAEPSEIVADALADGAPDTEANPRRAREETVRAVAWLAAHDDRATRQDFFSEVAADQAMSNRGWWERCVQPGLRELADRGLVEYRSNYPDYRWSG